MKSPFLIGKSVSAFLQLGALACSDMVSYVRGVHPLLAHFVETRQDGSFAISDDDLGNHQTLEQWINAIYEREVEDQEGDDRGRDG